MRGLRAIPVLVRPLGRLVSEIPDALPLYHLEAGGTRPLSAGPRGILAGRSAEPVRDGLFAGAASLLLKSRRLASIARREGAVGVASFLHKSHAIAVVSKLLWRRKLRVIVNVHEQPKQHLETHFPPSRRPLMREYYRRLLPRADCIVTVSDSIRDELVAEFAMSGGRIEVARNPIDTEALRELSRRDFPPLDLPRGPGPLIVAVGRLTRIKGFDLLIDAMAAVRRRIPARLAVVGDGAERVALRDRIAALGLEGPVSLLGFRENPIAYMAAADLLVVPSRTEAWPTVIGEALAVGTPVLAARCSPGMEEFLCRGEYGRLIPPEDSDALATAVVDLLSSPSELSRYSRAGLARSREFELAATVARYEAILSGALGSLPPSGTNR
jgi:glycosyltransferase involved in cell wall biosynthesis